MMSPPPSTVSAESHTWSRQLVPVARLPLLRTVHEVEIVCWPIAVAGAITATTPRSGSGAGSITVAVDTAELFDSLGRSSSVLKRSAPMMKNRLPATGTPCAITGT